MMILQQTRGALSSGDRLALDLQFSLDKTTTARIGPTPVFTRASSGKFIGSDGLIQTAAVNAARFDHDPITGICRGLLIEESRTNLLVRSAEFVSSAWTLSNLTGTSVSAPDGTNTATSFSDGVATGEHTIYGSFSPSNRPTTGAVPCTFSCFLKAGTVRYVSVNVTNFTNSVGMLVDTQTWQVVDAKAFGTGWTYTSSKLTNYGNGWYRAELTFTPPAATNIIPRISGAQSSTYSGPSTSYIGTNSTFIVWGAQLEAGPFATSYISTTTTSVVRSADVCSITGAEFSGFYNATGGTSFVSAVRYTNFGNPRSLTITNSTSGNRAEQSRGSTVEQVDYYAGGSFLHTLVLSAATVGVNYRIAHAMAANNFAASMNGANPVVNNSGVMLTADRMIIGSNFQGSSGFHNGTISAIRYYKKRLPNAKLQALTV